MTVFHLLAQSTAKAIARVGDRLTYERVTPDLGANACPYLGHVPYFAPKLTSIEKEELAGSAL